MNNEICLGSIFKYITEDLKLNIGFANRVISTEKLSKEDAEFLNLEENDPSLNLENVVYLSNGKAFDYSIEKYNYLKIKLSLRRNLCKLYNTTAFYDKIKIS